MYDPINSDHRPPKLDQHKTPAKPLKPATIRITKEQRFFLQEFAAAYKEDTITPKLTEIVVDVLDELFQKDTNTNTQENKP